MALHPSPLPAVLSPVVTPFDRNGSPDPKRLLAQCRWLDDSGVGQAVFGTNSEANSMSVKERIDCLEYLVSHGLSPDRMMPGTGACAMDDAITLTQAVLSAGCTGVLMLPPFYYKDVSDDGLFAYFSAFIEKIASPRLQVYVYNIPPVAKVGFSLDLLSRLTRTYPGTVVGMKDSSGDWSYTESVIRTLAPSGFRVYAGSETFLLRTLRAGGAGCISATANVNPSAIAALARDWNQPDAENRQARLDVIRAIFQKRPMIAAMKSAIAHFAGDPQWAELRPPLMRLGQDAARELLQELAEAGFCMPGRGPSPGASR